MNLATSSLHAERGACTAEVHHETARADRSALKPQAQPTQHGVETSQHFSSHVQQEHRAVEYA